MLGYFFAYDDDRTPSWWFFAGDLETSAAGKIELNAPLLRFEGGRCPACDFTTPVSVEQGMVSIGFTGAALAEVEVSLQGREAFSEQIVPAIFGTPVSRFGDEVSYGVPDLNGEWIALVMSADEDGRVFRVDSSELVSIRSEGPILTAPGAYDLSALVTTAGDSPSPEVRGLIQCSVAVENISATVESVRCGLSYNLDLGPTQFGLFLSNLRVEQFQSESTTRMDPTARTVFMRFVRLNSN